MKANELRLGNWVNHFDSEIKVGWAFIKDVSMIDKGSSNNYLDLVKGSYSPITLTEKWLLDFGFDNKYDVFQFHLSDFDVLQIDLKDSTWMIDGDFDYSKQREIYFVHHLQNIYFALTGEELTINQ